MTPVRCKGLSAKFFKITNLLRKNKTQKSYETLTKPHQAFFRSTVNVETSVLKLRFEKLRNQNLRPKKFVKNSCGKSSFSMLQPACKQMGYKVYFLAIYCSQWPVTEHLVMQISSKSSKYIWVLLEKCLMWFCQRFIAFLCFTFPWKICDFEKLRA